MPRTKPDNTTIHRVELGSWERQELKELIEPIQQSLNISRLAFAASAVGITAALGVGAYVAYWSASTVWGWAEKAAEANGEVLGVLTASDPDLPPPPIVGGPLFPLIWGIKKVAGKI